MATEMVDADAGQHKNLCCALAGRRQVVIEVVDIDADSEEEVEDIETPNVRQRNRWQRVAQSATKQCLRLGICTAV